MMQSLLLTGVSSAKNNDLKAHKENEKVSSKVDGSINSGEKNEQKESKIFSAVMQESLEVKDNDKQAAPISKKGELKNEPLLVDKLKFDNEVETESLLEDSEYLAKSDVESSKVDRDDSKDKTQYLNNSSNNAPLDSASPLDTNGRVLPENDNSETANTKDDSKAVDKFFKSNDLLSNDAEKNGKLAFTQETELTFPKELAGKLSSIAVPYEHKKMPIDEVKVHSEVNVEVANADIHLVDSEVSDSEHKELLSQIEAAQQLDVSVKSNDIASLDLMSSKVANNDGADNSANATGSLVSMQNEQDNNDVPVSHFDDVSPELMAALSNINSELDVIAESVKSDINDSPEAIALMTNLNGEPNTLDRIAKNSELDPSEEALLVSKVSGGVDKIAEHIKSEINDSAEEMIKDKNITSELNSVDISEEKTIDASPEVLATVASISGELNKVEIKGTKESVLDSFISTNESNKKDALTSSEKALQSLMNKASNTEAELNDEEIAVKVATSQTAGTNSEVSTSLPVMLKNESLAATQPVIDVNGARPNQTSLAQLDKSIAVNQQAQATNNLLQQPLNIQSKQAASMVGERVMMMISQGRQEVQIRLDPAELGSMILKVQVQQDQVQLNIQTQAGSSKDIIEQNMPRLREQLAQQGIQLGEANVQQQSQQQGQRNMEANNTSGRTTSDGKVVEEEQTPAWMPSKIPSMDQGIDYYA